MGLSEHLRRAARKAADTDRPATHTRREDLAEWVRRHLRDLRVVFVSNREPYSHTHGEAGIEWSRNAGGLTVALDAVAQAMRGVWVAHGSGDADRETVDEKGHVACPPDDPAYTLRRLWVEAGDYERYYAGFSNGGLWPLCHIVYVRPRFEVADWTSYDDVNHSFAQAVLDEVEGAPALVFLQDYHLARVAKHLRAARPDLKLALFWHIPWPNSEVMRRLPWREELLDGLLANDLLGFHIRFHALNFLQTVADSVEAKVDHEDSSVVRRGHRTSVRDFAIGVDPDGIGRLAESPAVARAIAEVRERYGFGEARIGLGVDRMDYTKGIPERLEALERLYELHPEWIASFRFLQVAVPSRIELEAYRAVAQRTREVAQRINERFAPEGQTLVHLVEQNLDFRSLVPLYRMADVCAVTSLHDGMNLVAKEYVASRSDSGGALVLSPFTGASREFERAWIASPYDREAMATAYHAALSSSAEERAARMRDLRAALFRWTVFDWAKAMLETAIQLPGAHGRAARGGETGRRVRASGDARP